MGLTACLRLSKEGENITETLCRINIRTERNYYKIFARSNRQFILTGKIYPLNKTCFEEKTALVSVHTALSDSDTKEWFLSANCAR